MWTRTRVTGAVEPEETDNILDWIPGFVSAVNGTGMRGEHPQRTAACRCLPPASRATLTHFPRKTVRWGCCRGQRCQTSWCLAYVRVSTRRPLTRPRHLCFRSMAMPWGVPVHTFAPYNLSAQDETVIVVLAQRQPGTGCRDGPVHCRFQVGTPRRLGELKVVDVGASAVQGPCSQGHFHRGFAVSGVIHYRIGTCRCARSKIDPDSRLTDRYTYVVVGPHPAQQPEHVEDGHPTAAIGWAQPNFEP